MNSREYYRTYLADDSLSDLSSELIKQVVSFRPVHALDFGCGTWKHGTALEKIEVCGIDVSFANLLTAKIKNDADFLILGTEDNLRHLCNFDVVFTVSVLDHIQEIGGIVQEFKRIANKGIILCETNDVPGDHYYPHDYESFGFTDIGFSWLSPADGANYKIWILAKGSIR